MAGLRSDPVYDGMPLPAAHGSGLPTSGGEDALYPIRQACSSPKHKEREKHTADWHTYKRGLAEDAWRRSLEPAGREGTGVSQSASPPQPASQPWWEDSATPGARRPVSATEREEEHKNWKAFISLDTNRNGLLEQEEFDRGLREYGINLPRGMVDALYDEAKGGRADYRGVTQNEWVRFAERHPVLRDVIFERAGRHEAAVQTLRSTEAQAEELARKRDDAEQRLRQSQDIQDHAEEIRKQQSGDEEAAQQQMRELTDQLQRQADAAAARVEEAERALQNAREEQARCDSALRQAQDRERAVDPTRAFDRDGAPGRWFAQQGMWVPVGAETQPPPPAAVGYPAEAAGKVGEELVAELQRARDEAAAECDENERKHKEALGVIGSDARGPVADPDVTNLVRREAELRMEQDRVAMGPGPVAPEDRARFQERQAEIDRERNELFPSPLRSRGSHPPAQPPWRGQSQPHSPAMWSPHHTA